MSQLHYPKEEFVLKLPCTPLSLSIIWSLIIICHSVWLSPPWTRLASYRILCPPTSFLHNQLVLHSFLRLSTYYSPSFALKSIYTPRTSTFLPLWVIKSHGSISCHSFLSLPANPSISWLLSILHSSGHQLILAK